MQMERMGSGNSASVRDRDLNNAVLGQGVDISSGKEAGSSSVSTKNLQEDRYARREERSSIDRPVGGLETDDEV